MASEPGFDETPVASGSNHQDADTRLPDNSVEYLIFHVDAKSEAKNQLAQLEAIRQSALKLSTSLSKDCIWQKDDFNIELKNKDGEFDVNLSLCSSLTPNRSGVSTWHHRLWRCCRRRVAYSLYA